MLNPAPLRWTDPSSWPFNVYIWIAFALLGWIAPAWRWIQRRRSASWPVTDGRVESVDWGEQHNPFSGRRRSSYYAQLKYSYFVAGTRYGGRYKQLFPTDSSAQEFIRGLQDQAVVVHYNPNHPETSALVASDLEVVLQNRPSAPSIVSSNNLPQWLIPWIWLFVGIAAVGLIVSLFVHAEAWMGRQVAPTPVFFLLHLGIFVVFFPALLVSRQMVGDLHRRDFWKAVLKNVPNWMRYMVYVFFIYAFLNFFLFMSQQPGHRGEPDTLDWRGFSGHWMLFYSASMAILYAAAREVRNYPRCSNGHYGLPGAAYCTKCGMPIALPAERVGRNS